MSEHDNLQDADGDNLKTTPQNQNTQEISNSEKIPLEQVANSDTPVDESTERTEKAAEPESSVEKDTSEEADKEVETPEPSVVDSKQSKEEKVEKKEPTSAEDSEAEKPEAEDSKKEEPKPAVDYKTLSLEDLITEFESLLKSDNIQSIRSSINEIKNNFNAKFTALISEKKEAFLAEGGNTIDFEFTSPLKKQFNELSKTFREKHQSFQKNRTEELKQNLEIRLHIIEEIKGLINVEGDINSAYKTFKNLQERWRNTGQIPSSENNNTWNNYRHHVEIFYGFLHLNRDLRDLDFKHNLEQKQKIILRTEELAKETDLNRAFRELQALHKIWKEELGPVAKEHKDTLWEQFSAATKVINDKRQDYYNQLEKQFEENLKIKNELIAQIRAISEKTINSHKDWQANIKEIETLREAFFKTGKVPSKSNEKTWKAFKDAVRTFNKDKNNYYKSLKKDQSENYKKKLELVEIAEQNKDSEDLETTLVLMKKIQNKWKTIGHIPRKDSDKLWKRFRGACNAFFDRYHEQKNNGTEEEITALEQKNELLETLKTFKLTDDKDKNLAALNDFSSQWKKLGHVVQSKRFIDGKFFKTIDGFYSKLGLDKAAMEDLKYSLKLETLAQDQRLFNNEVTFIRKKIDEIKSEINQLENNLQFFSNVKEDNPMVKEVHTNIDKHKAALQTWNAKYSKIKKMIQ